MNLKYALINDTSWQDQADWQTPDTPFMSFAFWQALSDTGAIGEQAGWLPIFILVYRTADHSIEDATNHKSSINNESGSDSENSSDSQHIDLGDFKPIAV